MRTPPFDEAATFVVALVVLICSFYGLLIANASVDAKVIYGGLIGSVATFYFQRSATHAANRATIDAQNNGLSSVRSAVARIEDGRTPTESERAQRDAGH